MITGSQQQPKQQRQPIQCICNQSPNSKRKRNLCNAARHLIITLNTEDELNPAKISKISTNLFPGHGAISESTIQNIIRAYKQKGRIEAKPKGGIIKFASSDQFNSELIKHRDSLKIEQFKELPMVSFLSLKPDQLQDTLQTIIRPAITDYINNRFQENLNSGSFLEIKKIQQEINAHFGTVLSVKTVADLITRDFYYFLDKIQLHTEFVDISDRVTNYRRFLLETLKIPETDFISLQNDYTFRVPESVIFIREHRAKVTFWKKSLATSKVPFRTQFISLTFAFSSKLGLVDTRHQKSELTISDWKESLGRLSSKVSKASTFIVFDVDVFRNEQTQTLVQSLGNSLEHLFYDKAINDAIGNAVDEDERLKDAQSKDAFLDRINAIGADPQLINWEKHCTEIVNKVAQRYYTMQECEY